MVFGEAAFGTDAGVDIVVAHVEGGVETAFVGEFVSDFGVGIVEVVASHEFGFAVDVGGEFADDGTHNEVGIGASGGDAEGSSFFDDGTFEVEFGRDGADGDIAVDFFVVAVVGGNVEDAGESSAEAGGETAFEEGDVLDGVGIESREEAAEMVDVVERDAVEEEEVLVRAASAHVHAAGAFVTGLYAGEELDGFNDVGFAKEDGDGFELFNGHFEGTHL